MIMTILSILMSEWIWSSRVIKSNEVQSKLFFCYAPMVTYLVVDSVQDTRPFVRCKPLWGPHPQISFVAVDHSGKNNGHPPDYEANG
jgi:hypothetical protein